MRNLWIALLLTVTALAGCTGGANDTDPAGTGGEGIGPGAIDDRVTVQANTSATDPVTFTESGALALYQSVCVDGCDYDQYSLIAEMEDGTAYFVEATLRWTPTAGQLNPVGMSLVAEAGVRDFAGVETGVGAATFTATLLAPGPSDVFIEVWPNGVPGEGGTASYDLEVNMTPVPDAIPQYAPAAVTVPDGGALLVESLSGAGRVMVFDGNEALVGVFPVDGPTTVVNATAGMQEFVIVTMDDIWAKAYVMQAADAPTPELRHLPIVVGWNDHGTVDSGGPQTFTFDAGLPLLQTGFALGFQDCVPGTCYRAVDWSATLFDPDGAQLVSDSGRCDLCGGSQGFFTDFIDGGVGPTGEYTLQWDSSESMSVGIRTVEVSYGR